MSLKTAEIEALIRAACEARDHAYAPHSHFYVGASVLTVEGTRYAGCNVENASYGLTICAERVAISAAIAQGHRDFRAIAVASHGGVTPCGACRQFLFEFNPRLTVIAVDALERRHTSFSLAQLLPDAFGRHDLSVQ